MKKSLLLAAMLASAGFAANANELSYTFVEGGYAQLNVNEDWLDNPKGNGGFVRGSVAIAPQAYVFGGYATVSDTYRNGSAKLSVSIDQTELGIGYHMAMGDRAAFTADIAYMRLGFTAKIAGIDPDLDGKLSDDAKGGKISVGVRGAPSPRTEAWLKAGYMDGSDFEGEFVGTLGGQVKFNTTWGLVGEVEVVEQVTRYFAGVRASF